MKKKYIIWVFIAISIVLFIINIGLYIKYRDIKSENYQLILMSRSYLQKSETLDNKINESSSIDAQFRDEIEMSNGVTSKIIEATTKYAGLWEQEMDKYYYLLMDALDEDNREYLIDSQKSWETYSNENCDLVFKSTAQLYGEGSYLNILEVDLILQKYRKRTYELKELYKSLGIAK